MFEGIIGNDHIKGYLQNMVASGSVGNSLLFSGVDGIGKTLFAEGLAKLLLSEGNPSSPHIHKIKSGNHPDIKHYRPEGKTGMHTIESMRQFNAEVYLRPNEAKWKVFIIHDAERMLPTSANALLKTFEEPSPDTIIILMTSAKESLLPTILSRCRTLHFHHVDTREIACLLIEKFHCQADEARLYAELSHGSVGRAIQLNHDSGDPVRDQILNFIVKGKVKTYFELTDFVKTICAKVDTSKKEVEEQIREELSKGVSEKDMTAAQLQVLKKEVEGAVALRLAHEASNFFNVILSWFRDLHLLYLGGDSRLLINKDYVPEIQKKVIEAEPIPVETVEKVIADARLSLRRSTSLAICLENLFLKLNFL
ncbi:MAG: AAA family ATPase [Chlamydiota bacterium]|nr:AAA family ATPase [Chlamydiota bacterium]